jgi:hypothetical protein
MCKVKFSLLVSGSHKFPLWKYLKQVKNVFGKQFVNQFQLVVCLNGTNLNQKNYSYSVFDSLANEYKIVNVDSN